MDNLLLETIVGEIRARLTGWPVYRLAARGTEDLVLSYDDPARSRLFLSAGVELPRMHLVRGRLPRGENPATPFFAAATHNLTGAILASVEKDPADRVVRFRFAGAAGPGKSLVVELLGRSSNIVLLDAEDGILGFARRLKSAFRAPVLGAPYAPPPSRSRRDPRTVTEAEIEDLARRSRAEAHPLADLLLEACSSLGVLAAQEIEVRAAAGESPFAVLTEWLGRAFDAPKLEPEGGETPDNRGGEIHSRSPEGGQTGGSGTPRTDGNARGHDAERRREGSPGAATQPGEVNLDPPLREERGMRIAPSGGFVYAEGPLEAILLGRAPAPGRFLLSPLPLASAPGDLLRIDFESVNAAAEAWFDVQVAGRAFRGRRDGLAGIARREAKRAQEIATKVAGDLDTLERAEPFKRLGEALLAGMTLAERRGSEVLVPDPYDPDAPRISVPIDPSQSLAANADRLFGRYRKAMRGLEVAAERLESQTRRGDRLLALAGRIEDAAGEDDLARAEEALRALGIPVGIERRRAGAPPAAEPRVLGVRVYTSSDGYEILVGKGAEENDRLTFKIASPEDFWMHASGFSGAHVIVRNPRIEKALPEATLREASQLAAFFSKAKESGRADVLVTRRKYVRRARGAPRGTVIVKKGQSIVVAPRNPFE